jgi:SAM-dependent methyltransferase
VGTIRREPVLGLKRLALPVSYWRTAEFRYVWTALRPAPGQRLFDLGSPKDLALFLARDAGCEVVAADLLPEAIELSQRFAEASGVAGTGPGHVASEVRDGRALPYPDASFDAAFSVSVVEHIPDAGDTQAMRELVRIVKPGGRIVVTTPFDLEHRDTYVDRRVYERDYSGAERVFFERHYDATTLRERLLDIPGTVVEDLQYWGEPGVQMERMLARIGKGRVLASPFEALLAATCLKPMTLEQGAHPKAVFFTLRKVQA